MKEVDAKDLRRLLALSIGMLILFCFIILQFYKLQIIEGNKWARQARAQHQFSVKEPFKRGSFFANNTLKEGHIETAQPLVFDVKRYHLFIDPISIYPGVRDEISEKIGELLSLDWKEKNGIRMHFEKHCRSRR